MKRISFLLLIYAFAYNLNAQGISFYEGTWKEALEEAKKDDKIVFVDSYAQWCGPCKRMAKTEFTKEEVGEFYNKNFINVKLDMEASDGMSFGSKYPVSAFPTLFYLDSQGNILKKVTGGQKAEQLIELGKVAIKSYDKTEGLQKMYDEGKRDFDLMVTFVKELNKVDKPSLKISNEYLNSNPDITKEQKAEFLMNAVTEADSKLFDQLVELKSEAIKATSKEAYENKVKVASLKTVGKAVEFDYKELVDEAIGQYKKAKVGNDSKFEKEAYLTYYNLTGEYEEWKSISKSFVKKYGKKDADLIKEHITTLGNSFNHIDDARSYANDLFKNLIKSDDSMKNYMSYINFLGKLNKTEELKKTLSEAIKKGKSRKEDVTYFERLLQQLT